LQVDPEWTWEPMAYDEYGLPLISNGGLWIKLTVAGVTRPGWGDGKNVKEMIGDAIRNAAMRFGVALDLWAKEDLRGDEAAAEGAALPTSSRAQSSSSPATQAPAPDSSFEVPEGARGGQEARDMTAAPETSKKKLKALAAKLIGENKATQTQLDSAMIALVQKSWGPALADPVLPKSVVDDLLARLGKLDRNAEKAQQEVAA
jgi:hypothetical protein